MRHASLSISEGVEETIAEYRAILGDLERRESGAAKEVSDGRVSELNLVPVEG